ncbi:uncharacterized protein PV09_01198 [Verruconis gallopava]|uniref:Alpha/beta hydrolase fold-3 domain-containing protein n=1 Tax=Verruconis gallopava TaxID=253628 RepID=A0A0D2ANG9_9PEZI|nr:uncharacterized protein PV09_01198 [Verruconis gallopava]KIW08278.1 hypothetical protein PV09_01198 [Verruconis gallopava]
MFWPVLDFVFELLVLFHWLTIWSLGIVRRKEKLGDIKELLSRFRTRRLQPQGGMDIKPSALARILLPKLPYIGKTAIGHALRLTSTSGKWDLRTELTVKIIRSLTSGPPQPISRMQAMSIRDGGVKGKMWVSRVKFPVPEEIEDGIREVTLRSIKELADGSETYWEPDLQPLEAEWTGYRKGVKNDQPEPSIAESAKYENLMKEVTSDVVILYFHGGAHFLMDPASHRGLVTKLARKTGGRVLSVRYRLSPQNPFPAALMDGLFAYLALLHPPPGSPHKPVKPSQIVFAGDSAGGQMCASLMQLLLQINRSLEGNKVRFHGAEIEVPLPAGMAMNSPWLDINRCMPSIWANAKYDYLPPPPENGDPEPPPCDIWPANPPRADLFCEGSALCHPLVSPLAAMDWKGAPPCFVVTGEECLADEDKILCQRMHAQGVKVVWEQYEAMPHVFCMVFEKTKISEMSFEGWANAIKSFVEKPAEVESKGIWVTAKKLEIKVVPPGGDPVMSDEECLRRMRESQEKRIKGFDNVMKARPIEPKL